MEAMKTKLKILDSKSRLNGNLEEVCHPIANITIMFTPGPIFKFLFFLFPVSALTAVTAPRPSRTLSPYFAANTWRQESKNASRDSRNLCAVSHFRVSR
jgi:hypothetical protein